MPVTSVIAQAVRVRYAKSIERRRVESNLDLFDRLPAESEVRDELIKHIDADVREVLQNEGRLRTDPSGIVLALALIVGAGLLALGAYNAESWRWLWILGAVATGLLGLVGFTSDIQRVERDHRGRRVK